MITNKDIVKLSQIFATKQDLENLATRADFRDTFNKVLDRLDAVFKEVRDTRMEYTSHFQKHTDLEEEIEAIKHTPTIAHELKRKH